MLCVAVFTCGDWNCSARRRGAISTRRAATSTKTYLGLKDGLEALLGRSVDLVEPGALRNPYLKSSIDAAREPVFEA